MRPQNNECIYSHFVYEALKYVTKTLWLGVHVVIRGGGEG